MNFIKEEAVDVKPSDPMRFPYLASLSKAQLNAVTANPAIPLQILAGPGSGKTRVLTSRVAYLVQNHGYRPYEITAVTFTNKAANEMRKRLEVLLGAQQAGGLILGTFHATCVRYLRRYCHLIGLPHNFSISDAEDSKKLMSSLLKTKAEILEGARMQIKEKVVLSEISKAKAKGESPEAMAIRAANDPSSSTSTLSIVAELYAEYDTTLREANCLDFDDLLVFGLRLFREVPRVLESCKHILVDEFQDTNTTQYELMRCFAEAHGGVSVVGDPDQSIYGWRSAEIENLSKMTKDFKGVEAIYLEENYRSTGAILKAAHSVVSQDRERIQKSLFTSHPRSTPVTLKVFSTPVIEASFISTEIKRLIAYSGGVLNYGDFAILLRYNALSRNIESALQKDSIPNRIIGGLKFFERMEIKDLLAYLQLAENPNFTPAFMRVVNVPRRGIGEKSVAEIVAAAKRQKISPMEYCEGIADGNPLPAGLKAAVKNGLSTFVGAVRKLRRAAERGEPVADLIQMAVQRTEYEQYLQTTQSSGDFESRWENVQELIAYSVLVAEAQARESMQLAPEGVDFMPASSAAVEAMVELQLKKEHYDARKRLHPMFRRTSGTSSLSEAPGSRSASMDEKPVTKGNKRKASDTKGSRKVKTEVKEEVIEIIDSDEEFKPVINMNSKRIKVNPNSEGEDEGLEGEVERTDEPDAVEKANGADASSLTPLSYFLQTSMLSTDTEGDKDDKETPKVTISTVHSAKGLEWPVVFIPAVENGTYPSYRCTEPHEIAEERRLLYVAMTRAQTFLSMSYTQFRMTGAEESDKTPSEFVTTSQKHDSATFSTNLPEIDLAVRRNIASMLGRPPPDEEATKEMIRKHIRAAPPLSMWDAPEPRDRNFNRFARRDITKATRAAEYWASEADDYALPENVPNRSGNPKYGAPGFTTGKAERDRLSKPYKRDQGNMVRSPPKPVVKLPPKDHQLPEMPTFNFGQVDAPKASNDLGLFTNASNSSLALMKSLGLPGEDDPPLLSPNPSITSPRSTGSPSWTSNPTLPSRFVMPPKPTPWVPSAAGLAKTARSQVNDWKSLGTETQGAGKSASGAIPLAKGTKRLGMGRPAPWGSKK